MTTEIILCAVIVIQAILHYVERQRLQDRIMSRNLNEFKQRDEPRVPHESAHKRVLKNWKSQKWRGSD